MKIAQEAMDGRFYVIEGIELILNVGEASKTTCGYRVRNRWRSSDNL